MVPDVKHTTVPKAHVPEADVMHMLNSSSVVEVCMLPCLLTHYRCCQLHLVLTIRRISLVLDLRSSNNSEVAAAACTVMPQRVCSAL